MAGGVGFPGPRGRMVAGGGGGGGGNSIMRVGAKGVSVGGKGGVADSPNSSSTSKPSSRCSSPTRTQYQRPLVSSTSTDNMSNSNKGGFSSGYYGLESPFSPYYGWPAAFGGEEYEWVPYDVGSDDDDEVHDVSEEDMPQPLSQDEGFLGSVPSPEEVHSAVSALNQVFGSSSYSQIVRDKYSYSADRDAADQILSPFHNLRRVASVGAELDWLEPSANLCNTRTSWSSGSDRVYDAFHLLQTDPSVQRMVISLSSDRAVWDAVLNNEAVRELRQTYSSDANVSPPRLEDSGERAGKTSPALNVIVWMLDSTRAKFTDLFEALSKLVNDLFQQPEEAAIGPPEPVPELNHPDQFEHMARTSLGLSILVLLIVAIARAIRARP